MTADAILARRDGAVLRLTLNAPPVNVITIAMLDTLNEEIQAADGDSEIRLIVLDANGKFFSAGVDVGDHVGEKVETMMHALERLFITLDGCETVIVSLVRRAAIGGGCELSLGADLCYASERAKFGQPEIKLGLMAPPASVLIPRMVGERRALDLLLTGRTIEAREAESMGLISRCFTDDVFESETQAILDGLLDLSAEALKHAKHAVRVARGSQLSDAHQRVNRLYLQSLMQTQDAHEGLNAFIEKRPPRWKHT